MPHPTGPTNTGTRKLITGLKRKKEKFYLALARHLEKPARSKRAVNIQKLKKFSKKYDNLVVPGKVLGIGELDKPVNVYAFSFSREARMKITKAGGKALLLKDMLNDADIKKSRIVV